MVINSASEKIVEKWGGVAFQSPLGAGKYVADCEARCSNGCNKGRKKERRLNPLRTIAKKQREFGINSSIVFKQQKRAIIQVGGCTSTIEKQRKVGGCTFLHLVSHA